MDARERDQWREASDWFQRLIDLDDPARDAALDAAAVDAGVRGKLALLLSNSQRRHPFLDADCPALPWPPDAGTDPAAADPDRLCGQRIGCWKLIERIGSGGMAVVYRAQRTGQDFGQTAAIKLLGVALHGEAERRRFRRERQILAQLQHPHIAGLIDAGLAEDGTPYLAMSLIDGDRIDHWCECHDASLRARVELLLQVCGAVACAHRQLIVHRDIKPGNILVDAAGHATLLDFGIARLLDADNTGEQTVTRAFTPDYAAPEQRSGAAIADTGVDIYGLGAVLHRLLAGKPPQSDARGEAVAAWNVVRDGGDAHAAVALRGDLGAILAKALARDPQQRYASADAMAADLRAWLQYRPVQARHAGPWARIVKFTRRNRAASVLAALAIAAAGAGLIAFVLSNRALQRRAAELQAVTEFQLDMLQKVSPRDVGEHLHKALTEAIATTGPEQSKGLEGAIARLDYAGLAIDMLDEAILRRSVHAARSRFAVQPRVRGLLLQQLAIDYRDLGRYAQSAPIQSEATQVLRKAFGEGDPLTLMSLRESLKLIRRTGSVDAEARHREVLRLHEQYLGSDSLETETARAGLAQWLMEHGKAAQAESLLRRVAEHFGRLKGEDDPDAVAARVNLAYAVSALGRYGEAENLYRRCVEDSARVFGPDHPFTLTATNDLAWVLKRNGKPEEAGKVYQAVYVARRRTLGEKHPDTLAALNNYAATLCDQGRHAQAEPLRREAYESMREISGPQDPKTLNLGLNLGKEYLDLGRYHDGVALAKTLLAGAESAGNPLSIARAQRLLGQGLQGLGRLADAREAYELSWQAAAKAHNVEEQRKVARLAIASQNAHADTARTALWQARATQGTADAPTKSATPGRR